ncbi:hypothetical protein [Desulfolutivibrio sulfoxidireducens]|uniref:hypothetical protein n=2 Tax=Desulfolutivibrio sulfoxidireducens TaxID=2773299 RepID=UPI00159D2C49|nr:hypothetical protein [Desulfolutivibrio sulfoxidireducens]QLA19055.1 hypothetical protein GD604_04550 [Desulfolutivibrio sulfoxidireducens]
MNPLMAGGGTKVPTPGFPAGAWRDRWPFAAGSDAIPSDGEGTMCALDIAGINSMYSQLSSTDDTVKNSLAAKVAARKYISDNDTDGDGVLSQTETGFSDDSFTSVDADGNGAIDYDEMHTQLKSSGSTLYDYLVAKTPAVKYELVSQFLDVMKK